MARTTSPTCIVACLPRDCRRANERSERLSPYPDHTYDRVAGHADSHKSVLPIDANCQIIGQTHLPIIVSSCFVKPP